MMKWLHLPWHIEGNRVVHTREGWEICRFETPPGAIPVEEHRPLQLTLDRLVEQQGDPWRLLERAISAIEEAGYSVCSESVAL